MRTILWRPKILKKTLKGFEQRNTIIRTLGPVREGESEVRKYVQETMFKGERSRRLELGQRK